MKKLFMIVLLLPAVGFAADNDDHVIRWKSIAGVITAPNVDNSVAGIHSGTFPWVTRQGRVRVNIATSGAAFENPVAPLRRKSTGPFMPKTDWLHYADG